MLHEFTTVPGVKEDVTDIILNLKELVVSSEHDEPVVMYLRKQGPGAVTAADIAPPAGVEVHNPELHIATLNGKGKLEMELTVERGRGYVSATQNKQPGQEIGRIPIDSIYSPVLKVTYKVEATRVEQRTDFDRLILDVETKPCMRPRDAVASAGKTLVELFGLARELNVEAEGIDIGPSPTDAALAADLALPIEELNLTVRSYNCLKREGIHTVGELVARSEQDLLDIRNFGAKSIEEVKQKLHDMGLALKDSPPGFDPSSAVDNCGTATTTRATSRPSSTNFLTGSALGPPTHGVPKENAMPTPTKGARLGGSPAHQRLILANLATALFEHGKITTTEARAKRLRPLAEKLITKAKRGDMHARRQVLTVVRRQERRRAHPLHRDRPDHRRASRRLHPDHQDRPPQGRRRPDGGHRAGLRGAGANKSRRRTRRAPAARRSRTRRPSRRRGGSRRGRRGRGRPGRRSRGENLESADEAADESARRGRGRRGREAPAEGRGRAGGQRLRRRGHEQRGLRHPVAGYPFACELGAVRTSSESPGCGDRGPGAD